MRLDNAVNPREYDSQLTDCIALIMVRLQERAMKNRLFIITLLVAVIYALPLPAARFCPEIICGKPQQYNAVKEIRGYKEITLKQLRALLETEQPVLLLDARPENHDDLRRIPNATRLPFDSSAHDIEAVVGPRDTLVVVYCTNVRCLASRYLAESMVRLGYTRVLKYADGLEGWLSSGQPISMFEKPQKR